MCYEDRVLTEYETVSVNANDLKLLVETSVMLGRLQAAHEENEREEEMEKLRMYNPVKKEEKETLKTPQLDVRGKDLVVVDDNGKILVHLLHLANMTPYLGAREELTGKGYRTDWAEWGNYGSFQSLLEDVES